MWEVRVSILVSSQHPQSTNGMMNISIMYVQDLTALVPNTLC
jgi:hypothetical protein